MKNLFDQLKSEYQHKLIKATVNYSSVDRLIDRIKEKNAWRELTINEFNSFCTWADIVSSEISINDIKYGDRFIEEN